MNPEMTPLDPPPAPLTALNNPDALKWRGDSFQVELQLDRGVVSITDVAEPQADQLWIDIPIASVPALIDLFLGCVRIANSSGKPVAPGASKR